MTQAEYDALVGVVSDLLAGERERAKTLEARVRALEQRKAQPVAIVGDQFKAAMAELIGTVKRYVGAKTAPLEQRIEALEQAQAQQQQQGPQP